MRKAVGVHLAKSGFWVFSDYRVALSRRRYVSMKRSAFEAIRAGSAGTVVEVLREPGRTLWAVAGEFYWDTDNHSAEEIALIVWDRGRRKEARVERLQKIRARPDAAERRRRELIPDDVRVFVWERDQGQCVRCQAEEDLQFDHIIPVAKGGASSIENLQLLCGDCNRLKSDSIV